MNEKEILSIFEKSGALLSGHFALTSGLHSDTYFQCALVLQFPAYAARLCAMGGDLYRHERVDVVMAPAVGGIVVGYELARVLGARAIFAERQHGKMQLRRGFALRPGETVVVAEDVVTTGGSVKEVVALAGEFGAAVRGVFAIVDRSAAGVDFGVPFNATLRLAPQTFEPAACPLCKQGVALQKPGSRDLASA